MRVNVCIILVTICLFATSSINAAKTRVIVTSDIGGSDPDDQQSFVHLLTLLDKLKLEGFIYQHAWVSFNKGNEVEVVNKVLEAYEKVWSNLCIHGNGFPDVNYLRNIIKHGQIEATMKGVGEGKDSPGSELIIQIVDRDDTQPVWIVAWSGMNTLAQALWKIKHTRTELDVRKFVQKIRVYDILGQDDAGAWIMKEFPELIYIRNKEVYGWPPSDEWFKVNVQTVGELGKQYPNRIWATEGDSPSFLYVINNGLNFPEHPDWGGWGGRFDLEEKANIRSMDWVLKSNLDETVYDPYYMLGSSEEGSNAIIRWINDINNDFAARMIWTTTNSYKEANHHPIAIIGKNITSDFIHKKVKAGKAIKFDASNSFDPDDNELSYEWTFYKEASSYKGHLNFDGTQNKLTLFVPIKAKGKNIHLILRVIDNGKPSLTSYRRIILECE